ncbi:MAG: class I SAM-dependent RNA methyltransferase [Candidatus Omnitrophica bacterium]|nr:class I SAM-dependent RNA methyltransferase [Candidatus Omnitrophota bacterium]
MIVLPQIPHEVRPVCPHFGSCGGCQHQDISYHEELRNKESGLVSLLTQKVSISLDAFSPIVPSPQIYHYRNRLDLKLVKRRDGRVDIGFSPERKAPVLEIEACLIAMEKISRFIPRLRLEASGKIPKDYRMANLTVRCGDGGDVRWGGIGRRSLRLAEADHFYTDILGHRIYYSLDTFFQANLSILPELGRIIRALPVWDKEAVFFDLYGGVGLFGILVHDLVARVVNIEENVHAVRIAERNVRDNGLNNVEVLPGRIEDVLPKMLNNAKSADNIVMIDPPRAGLSDKAIRLLNSLERARHLLYLSCNPQSLAENLVGLSQGHWATKFVQPLDFFPRTRHVETLVLLQRN